MTSSSVIGGYTTLSSLVQVDDSAIPLTRAVFDLGSGTFKLLVAQIKEQKIQIKFSKTVRVGLGLDLAESTNGMLSEKVEKTALDALHELLRDAKKQGATQFVGIATAAFRNATNGQEVLQKLIHETSIPLRIISQEEEGIFGFKTVLAFFPELKEEKTGSLDLGAASFQLTFKNKDSYAVFHGPLGLSKVSKMFSEEIRNMPYSRETLFIPIRLEELVLLVEKIKNKISLPEWLKLKLMQEDHTFVYFDDWIDEIQARTGGSVYISKEQIWKAVVELIDSSEFANPRKQQAYILGYVSLYAIMNHFEIKKLMTKMITTGNSLGIMTEPHFWP